MGPCIILLKQEVMFMDVRHNNGPRDLITVSLCIQNVINKMHLCSLSITDACPYHNPTTTMGHSIHNIDISKALTHSTSHTLSAICPEQCKPRFIHEENTSPTCQTPSNFIRLSIVACGMWSTPLQWLCEVDRYYWELVHAVVYAGQAHPKHAQQVTCSVSMLAMQELGHFQLPRIVYRSLQHGAMHYLAETSMPHTLPAICPEQCKQRFIREENTSPMCQTPSNVSICPLKSVTATSWSQVKTPMRTTSMQLSFPEMVSDSLCRNCLVMQTNCFSSCLSGWSQTILEVNLLDVEVLGWCGYTSSAVVRPVGCTAIFSETPLEMAYGGEMNIQYTSNRSG
ncbi:uncharacterized protein [Nothobranchius furzeri]|uniref:uncharacterized protein n=1 Tax=Nothobranchius furzeri TaxID=105023 RepID=UPI0039049BF9